MAPGRQQMHALRGKCRPRALTRRDWSPFFNGLLNFSFGVNRVEWPGARFAVATSHPREPRGKTHNGWQDSAVGRAED
jgi:hypothetical protein